MHPWEDALMPEDRRFDELMARLQAGNEAAASQIYEFASRLIGLARQHLDYRLCQELDAKDVVKSVFSRAFLCARARDSLS
jgi:hypothetical protein